MSTPTPDTTTNYALPLPHPANEGADDCLRLRLAIQGVDAALALKADTATVNTNLAQKADLTTMNTGLSQKANTTALTTELAKKAEKIHAHPVSEVTNLQTTLNTKADLTALTALGTRVDDLEDGAVTVITISTITGPASAPIGHAVSYTVSASSGLQNGSIASFRYKFGTSAEKPVTASNGSAAFPITVPAGTAVNTKFTLTVTAVDNYGNKRNATKEIAAIVASVSAPTVTGPTANTVVSPISVALTSNAFATTGASDTHAASHWKICSDAAGANILWQSGRNTTSKISITATPTANALTPGGTVYAFVKHEGTSLGEGAWSAGVKLTVASVVAPTITSPAAGATVYASGVTITTSAFACSGGITDTHKSTDWKITSDAAGNTVVVQALASANKNAHTFTDLNITDSDTYYLWSRHNGTSCGASPWSAARNVIINMVVTTPGERKLYRHVSGKGTVMEFNDGQVRKVMIPDAVYRGKAVFGADNTESPLTNYQSANTRGDWYLNTSNAVNTNAATKMTDAQINSLWSGCIDINTAKQNGDVWMTYSDTAAVAFCRNVSIAGKVCDLPNIQTIMRIFLEADELDKLDPTVAANKTKALGTQNSSGFWKCMGTGHAWSSTEYGHYGVRRVHYSSSCKGSGKSNEAFVVPVQEL